MGAQVKGWAGAGVGATTAILLTAGLTGADLTSFSNGQVADADQVNANFDAINDELSPWYVIAKLASGSQISLTTGTVSSTTEVKNAGLSMTLIGDSASAKIPCSGTNPPTGLNCSAGDEAVGVVFTNPSAGTYRVCTQYVVSFGLISGGDVVPKITMYETPTNNITPFIQDGHTRPGTRINDTGPPALRVPVNDCGFFTFADVQERAIRMFYTQSTAPTVNFSILESPILISVEKMR